MKMFICSLISCIVTTYIKTHYGLEINFLIKTKKFR